MQAPIAQAHRFHKQRYLRNLRERASETTDRLRSRAGRAKPPRLLEFRGSGAVLRALPSPRHKQFDDVQVASNQGGCFLDAFPSNPPLNKNKPAQDTSSRKTVTSLHGSYKSRGGQKMSPARSSEPARPVGLRLPDLHVKGGSSCSMLCKFRSNPACGILPVHPCLAKMVSVQIRLDSPSVKRKATQA